MANRKIFAKDIIKDYTYVVAKEEPLSFVSESLQKVILNLEYVNVDKKLKSIQFTSTLATEGKTTAIANIGYLLAQKHKKVIIIDLDLRKPKLYKVFDVANENGITDFLSDKVSLEKAIQTSEELGVDYILSGEKTTAITNVLEANKLTDTIHKLEELYDYVLIDSPPVLAVSDALYISKIVDGIVYIVAQNFAKKSDVKEAVLTLSKTGANILGTMMTQVVTKTKGGSYYYQYEYKE